MARPNRTGTHPATLPLPAPNFIRSRTRGYRTAGQVRYLYGQGCSLDEITAFLAVSRQRVRQVLRDVPSRRAA